MKPDDPLPLNWDLLFWSLARDTVALGIAITIAYLWYRDKPHLPCVLFSVGILVGLSSSPVLAIVCSIMLGFLIISTQLRIATPLPVVTIQSASIEDTDRNSQL
jgi:hypothetical protein